MINSMRVLMVASLLCSTLACEAPPRQPSAKEVQASHAQQAAEQIDFSDNAEINNIKRRLELTAEPGLLGFVLLLNESGQPIMYTTAKGKITSGGKRLTAPVKWWGHNAYGVVSFDVSEAPSDEGTWGSSDSYIYFWTTSGQYVQWNGKYLYSDKPIRLTVEPLVVDIQTE